MIDEMEVIGFPLIVPITFAHPLKPIKPAIENDWRGFDQVEINRAELADERTFAGIEGTAAMLRKPRLGLGRSRMPPYKIDDWRRIIETMRMMFASALRDERNIATQLA